MPEDPDHYVSSGHPISWPFRWATMDINYIAFYLSRWKTRPFVEFLGQLVYMTLGIYGMYRLVGAGYGAMFLYQYVIPTRISIMFLAYSFDFLPHHECEIYDATDEKGRNSINKFKATKNRVGFEFFMNFALFFQNYHLIHHLYPRVPFYKYFEVWNKNIDFFLDNNVAMVNVIGQPITVDQFRKEILQKRT